jgi:hypothetical protein
MKIYSFKIVCIFLLLCHFAPFSTAQTNVSNDVNFDVNKIFPAISVSPVKLAEANTLKDLNKHFKPEWVSSYLAVNISAKTDMGINTEQSKNNILTEAQKQLIHEAQKGTAISVNIQYIPKNNLSQNDPKEWDFTFTIDPDNEAKFIGHENQLMQYLQENAISKLPENSFEGFDFVAIKFTIDESGAIVNPHIYGNEYRTSKNVQVDQILLEAIKAMPNWEAASYSNGKKAKQESVFTVGNHKNCVINTLNIPKYALK